MVLAVIQIIVVAVVVTVINSNGYRFGSVALLAITCNVENMYCVKVETPMATGLAR